MGGVLDGKVAVVTGGGTGIGEATARRLTEAGCKVVVVGRRKAEIDRVAGEISGLAIATDVAVEDDVKALFKACEDAYGRLDVLVNNAGTGGARAVLADVDMADWDQTIAVNLRGVALCIKYAVPLLKRQGGSIVNVSSRDAVRGSRPTRSDYVASKFAVNGLTEAVAQELGPLGIRVNDVCPGAVATDLMKKSVKLQAEKLGKTEEEVWKTHYMDTAALRKFVEPEEVAATVLFLACDEASAITGEHLKVDSGRI